MRSRLNPSFKRSSFSSRLRPLSLTWHLLLSHAGFRVLLREQGPGLVRFLVEVLEVGDEADGINNALVVEKHASNLSSCVTVLSLDHLVDTVANLLASLRRVKLVQPVEVDLRKASLLGHHLLLQVLSLVGCHLTTHCLSGLLRLRVLLLVARSLTSLSRASVRAITSAVVELVSSVTAALGSGAALVLEAPVVGTWSIVAWGVLALLLEVRVGAAHASEGT